MTICNSLINPLWVEKPCFMRPQIEISGQTHCFKLHLLHKELETNCMKIRKKLAYRLATKVFFFSGRMLVFVSLGIIQQKLPIVGAGHVSVEIIKIRAASLPLRCWSLDIFIPRQVLEQGEFKKWAVMPHHQTSSISFKCPWQHFHWNKSIAIWFELRRAGILYTH